MLKDRGEPGAPTAADYRKLLIDARKQQLSLSRENLLRLMQTYDKAANEISKTLVDVPAYMLNEEGALREAYRRQIMADMDRIIVDMADDYGKRLMFGMYNLGQQAAAREDAVQQMMAVSAARDKRLQADLSRTETLSDGAKITVQFGRVAQAAVEKLAGRYYRDGLTLSERVHGQVTTAARKAIEDAIVQAVAEGTSAVDLAAKLETLLTAPATGNARYNAMRIARTEISNAHREAHVQSTVDSTGQLKEYISAVGFRLSLSHPRTDICDIWASDDSAGLGSGNYLPEDTPIDHPHGLCYTVSVLTYFPGADISGKTPDPQNVPQSEIDSYAAQGDAVALANKETR